MTDSLIDFSVPRGYRLVRVSAADDATLAALERTWARIRELHPAVPAVLVEIGPGRDTSCGAVGWDQPHPVIKLNLLRGDRTATGAELLERLLHYAAHGATYDPDRPVMASEGRWHGQAYRDAASNLGLDAETTAERTAREEGRRADDLQVAGTGWAVTSLARGTLSQYRGELEALNRALSRWQPSDVGRAARSSRNPSKAVCSCVPARIIRVSRVTFDLGGIRCEVCGEPFKVTS